MTFGSAPGPLRSPPLPSAGAFCHSGLKPALPHLLGRGTGRHTLLPPPGQQLLPHARSTYFLRFLRAHISPGNAPMHMQHPSLMAAPLSPRGCGLATPFVLPLHTSHPFPHITLLQYPPGYCALVRSSPLDCLAHARGDLPLGVAPCVLED